MATKLPLFDYPICVACNMCAEMCPLTCIEMKKTGIDHLKKVYPLLTSPSCCTGCSICKNACPVEAISMKN
jgi:formate hydrogenlyase subunit 6/NADH:ubiquinone oxidoreductase subunit I